jgi:hypothetical protein
VLKSTIACISCVGFLLSAVSIAEAQTTGQMTLNEVTVRGSVQAVDRTARTVTVQGDDGRSVTLDVPTTATRFEQLKVGDVVTMTYYDRVSVRPKPAGEAAVNEVIEPTTTPLPGALPGATRARQRVATMTLRNLDATTRSVTFSGPAGNSYTRFVVDTVDPAVFASLKVGDRVDVTWTEALSLQVTAAPPSTPPAAAPVADSFRHRTTISVQFGVDNQFSGNMIKASTGTTTGGQPINLTETTFDSVYGRIGMLKIGTGYRTSPRTEAVFNFVWSDSDADESATRIGTAGTAGEIPLDVNFTSYKYWGIEGGNRWYFARTRFTPYLGYLVGINRHQDIRGTFVGVPTSATPGLAAQDGKFFEKSWALSVGPTGGVLIGVGPIEVMGEFQLRYLGKLSDVDWLVEEGLKNINDESSRWSIPFVLGARLRF